MIPISAARSSATIGRIARGTMKKKKNEKERQDEEITVHASFLLQDKNQILFFPFFHGGTCFSSHTKRKIGLTGTN